MRLNESEEADLLRKKDEKSIERLINCNQALIYYALKKFGYVKLLRRNRDELISAAQFALFISIKKYDIKYLGKVKFASFALHNIWQMLHNERAKLYTRIRQAKIRSLDQDHHDARKHSKNYEQHLKVFDKEPVEVRIKGLTKGERELIQLKYFDYLSCTEIAKSKGCSKQNIEQRLGKALIKLRKFNKGYSND